MSEIKSEIRETYPNRFQPGQSGNPSGRPKKTEEEKEALERIRRLAPDVADYMRSLLDNPRTPAVAKVRILEIILERTYGKPESSIKLTTAQQSVEASEARIQALVRSIRISTGMEGLDGESPQPLPAIPLSPEAPDERN